MKIIQACRGGCGDKVDFIQREEPIKDAELYPQEAGEKYTWVFGEMKSMSQLLRETECYFDGHGNLCLEGHQHLAPLYFGNLGQEFHFAEGCGFSLPETDWLFHKKTVIKR